MSRAALSLLLLATVACSKPAADPCERAMARLERIAKAKGHPAASKLAREESLRMCRTGKHTSFDPVLRCAFDSKSDADASACIDRVIDDVLAPSAAGEGGGAGLNPLLAP